MNQDYKEFQEKHMIEIENMMIKYLTLQSVNKELLEAMVYSVQAGGKRFRPLLVLMTLDFLGKPINEASYSVAAALEMVHTYSLIHDDLPAMDNDDFRRGKPTNHKVFGEDLAILAGDGLLTESFGLLASLNVSGSVIVELVKNLCQASGIGGMIAGQVSDMQAEKTRVSLEELEEIHQKKTGQLISCSVKSAIILSEELGTGIEKELMEFSKELGLAFQIKDDLLDVLGDEKLLGKPVGSDVVNGKSTYVSLLGVDGAISIFNETCNKAEESLMRAKKSVGKKTTEVTLLDDILRNLREIV